MNVLDITTKPFKGLTVEKLLKNESCEAIMISIEAGHSLPKHSTPKEALLLMHQGEAVYTMQGEDTVLTPGITFKIPTDLEHSIIAKKDSIVFVIR
ncbi:MAG: cupin domain-containing protein [Cyclobacteriaceae bacterium]|nr:cupin domain-containing protein [Cyclobacteriaceae bacterium]